MVRSVHTVSNQQEKVATNASSQGSPDQNIGTANGHIKTTVKQIKNPKNKEHLSRLFLLLVGNHWSPAESRVVLDSYWLSIWHLHQGIFIETGIFL